MEHCTPQSFADLRGSRPSSYLFTPDAQVRALHANPVEASPTQIKGFDDALLSMISKFCRRAEGIKGSGFGGWGGDIAGSGFAPWGLGRRAWTVQPLKLLRKLKMERGSQGSWPRLRP